MDNNNHCGVRGCDIVEADLEMKKKYKLLKLHPNYYTPACRGDERIVIGGIPIVLDHQNQEIIVNSNIKKWQLNNICDYLVKEGYIDK
jgi:hypothetical protein